jgi:hypothetical protein
LIFFLEKKMNKKEKKAAWFPNQNLEQAEENKVDRQPQQKEMALVEDLDTSSKQGGVEKEPLLAGN